MNIQANQEIEIVESSLSKEFDGFNKKFDMLQQCISHQEEENLKEECLTQTIFGLTGSTATSGGIERGTSRSS